MKLVILPSFILAASFSLSARDLAPEYWIEEVSATDDSVQTSLVFRTVPGVAYQVETSEGGLDNWISEAELYGMGHEFVVPMREFTPPPPLPPGTPPASLPPPATNVSVILQASSAPAGGTVVSWRSLDNGGPMAMRLATSLHQDWATVPLYFKGFGNHYFFVMHPSQAAVPPASNPPLGTKDAAMIALLGDSLPAMNQEVADNAENSRNSPPPAPMASGAKKFWRIRADWSGDTDGDGSKDWAEFEMASNSGHPSHDLANPFNGDVDGNGTPDGQQIDFDQDDTNDGDDIDPGDPVVDQVMLPEVRYALFPIAGTAPPPDRIAPLEINNQGIVLYKNGTWKSGQWTPLEPQGIKLRECSARGINDGGEIVGVGSYQVREVDNYWQSALTRWP